MKECKSEMRFFLFILFNFAAIYLFTNSFVILSTFVLIRYGALEGLSKPELAALLGEEQVQLWRAGVKESPPPMTESHSNWHAHERKYKDVPKHLIPVTESLQDVLDRVAPFWESHIYQDLKMGRNVMVVAHNNSLRGIVKIIDNLTLEQILVSTIIMNE